MEFFFTNEATLHRTDEIVAYLRGPRLWIPTTDYPDFLDWTQKVHEQLRHEEKRALVAMSGGQVVGASIYQRHREEADALEVKNITVRPDQQGRYVASFLLRNAELEGERDFPGVRQAVVDAKAGNFAVRRFLLHHAYVPAALVDLYGLGAGADVVFRKRLRRLVI